MPRTMSAAAREAISQAQKRRWARVRKEERASIGVAGAGDPVVRRRKRAVPVLPVPDALPVVNTPATNGKLAELSVTLHVAGQTVQLSESDACAVYDALGQVLHRHGLSAT